MNKKELVPLSFTDFALALLGIVLMPVIILLIFMCFPVAYYFERKIKQREANEQQNQ